MGAHARAWVPAESAAAHQHRVAPLRTAIGGLPPSADSQNKKHDLQGRKHRTAPRTTPVSTTAPVPQSALPLSYGSNATSCTIVASDDEMSSSCRDVQQCTQQHHDAGYIMYYFSTTYINSWYFITGTYAHNNMLHCDNRSTPIHMIYYEGPVVTYCGTRRVALR